MTEEVARQDAAVLVFDVSDEALEAAARPRSGPIFSFPNAPTVSIVVVCCPNDIAGASPSGL